MMQPLRSFFARRATVPKLVKGWREEDIQTQARHYIKTYILLPSGFLGLICLLGGIGTLGYQLIGSNSYTWTTFTTSSCLLLIGGLCGWIQTRYHRYLFKTVPAVFAARMRSVVQRTQRNPRGGAGVHTIESHDL